MQSATIQFVAAQHLSAVMLHMVERTKVLGTACFGVIILQTSLRSNQWLALLLIVVGVFLAQSHHEEASDGQPTPNVFLGICAALAVSLVSSFSGVWLELVLKSDQTPLALRNVQLALYSIPLQLLICHHFGHPLLVPLSWISSLLAINLAFAGLLVATIVRFADNNLKNLAQALLPSFPRWHPSRCLGSSLTSPSVLVRLWSSVESSSGQPNAVHHK